MEKTIIILSSGHTHNDERIFWKFGRSLQLQGNKIIISTSTEAFRNTKEGIIIDSFEGKNMKKKEKVNQFLNLLKKYAPDIIICSEPLTILPSARFRKTANKKVFIISDITEWYPENYTLKLSGLKRIIQYFILWLFNLFTIQLVNGIIIGEVLKKKRYDIIAPTKKKIIIGYYPILKFFKFSPPSFDGSRLTLCYAGLLKFDRGLLALLDVCRSLKQRHPEIQLKLKIAGKFGSLIEQAEFLNKIKNIQDYNVEIIEWTEYPNISDIISEADICFDLRVHNFVYDNSLPIKVFEYTAAGRPFIFTDIKPLRAIKEINKFGHLVEPHNLPAIINILESYIQDPKLLEQHSREARKCAEDFFNWEAESIKLIGFVHSFT